MVSHSQLVNPSLLGGLRRSSYLVTIVDEIEKLLELGLGDPEKLKAIRDTYEKDGMISIEERKYVNDLIEKFHLD